MIAWVLSRGSAELPIDDASPFGPPLNAAPFPQPLTAALSVVTVLMALGLVACSVLNHIRGRNERAVVWTFGLWVVLIAMMLQALTPIIIRSSEIPTVELARYLRDLPEGDRILLWVERECDSTVYYAQRRIELRTKAESDFPTTVKDALERPEPVVLVADAEWAEQAPSLAQVEVLRRFGTTTVVRLRPLQGP
jgi:hypothetical protein